MPGVAGSAVSRLKSLGTEFFFMTWQEGCRILPGIHFFYVARRMGTNMSKSPAWTDLRGETARVIAAGGLDIEPLGLAAWRAVECRVTGHFTNCESGLYWSWENAIAETFDRAAAPVPDFADVASILSVCIPHDERVWLFLEGSRGGRAKFWGYEGTVPAITALLGELPYCDFYIVSKKLAWLAGQDHHDVLYGVGGIAAAMREQFSHIKP